MSKKTVYPIVLTPIKNGGFSVTVPDMGNHTEGSDLADAITMAQDAIEMMGVFLQDEGKPVPPPSDISAIEIEDGEIKTLVTIDFDAYRRATETKVVRKGCNASVMA